MTQDAASSVALSPFIHLRVHTAYSLLEGAVKVKKLTGLCEQYRMPAVAMTDSNNLFGAFEMSTECSAHGIQPIIGIQAPHSVRPHAEYKWGRLRNPG